jgi:hypothetical protein
MQNTQIGVQSVVGRVLNYCMLKVMVCVSGAVFYRFDCSTELLYHLILQLANVIPCINPYPANVEKMVNS